MSLPIFPPYRELLKENCPEMKRNFVKFRLETGHWITYLEMPKGVAQIRQYHVIWEFAGGSAVGVDPSDLGHFSKVHAIVK